MSLSGLRSFSGPFDWIVSDFQSVLKMIESDFDDFMNKDNIFELPFDPNKTRRFIDEKYGFLK